MKLPGFIPEELRQLARFVPLSGWDAVEWMPLLSSMRSITWRYVSHTGVRQLRQATQRVVTEVDLVSKLSGTTRLTRVSDGSELQRLGDDLLRLYFSQWLVDEGLFIDLRIARFGTLNEKLAFAPNGLWIRLRPEFRLGMLALYRSFYSADDTAFEEALEQMGMLQPGMSDESRSELKALLHSHFGIEQHDQRFSIDTFKASFDDLFDFFIANDYKLHSDFVFVGFYLITLYLTLEQFGQSHNVREICSATLVEHPST